MKYYLFNAKTNEFIMKCTEEEFNHLKKTCSIEIVDEIYDTGCDGYGNEFLYVNVTVIFL